MISLAVLRFCLTAAVKKATGRCCNTPIVNQEIRRLKAMSSPRFDTSERANLEEKSFETSTGGGAVSVTVSVSLGVRGVGVNSDSPSADNETVANVKDANDSVTISPSCVTTEQTSDEKKPSTLSKRAARRQRRKHGRSYGKTHGDKAAKNVSLTEDTSIDLTQTSYYFENGLRKVYPYYFTFSTHVKGRWVARTVNDVFTSEFLHGDGIKMEEVIESGRVKVNGKCVKADYKFKDNDFLESAVHRHEVPVKDSSLEILEDTDDMVVINKPCSIPVHPCGRYRHNSLVFILAKEHGLHNLRTIYRLDRLTSGLLFFAKTERKTKELMDNIRKREMSKEYVCRVVGEFPKETIECREPLDVLTHKLGLWKVGPNGKPSHTTFERVGFNGTSSVVRCHLHTGRTHQIRVHLQYLGYPIVNDPLYNCPVWGPEIGKKGEFGKSEEQLVKELLEFHVPVKYIEKSEPEKDSSVDELAGDQSEDSCQPRKKQKLCDSAPSTAINMPSVGQLQHEPASSEDIPTRGNGICSESTQCSHCETEMQIDVKNVARPSYDPSKMTFDASCAGCRERYRDPTVEELTMYLHALRYQGPGWEYSTPLPDWAKDDWKD